VKWLDEERDAYLLGLMRVLLGCLLVVQGAQRLDELGSWGFFGAYFHLPLLPPGWVPSLAVYRVLLYGEMFAGLVAISGLCGREGLLAGACIGLYLMLCDRLQYHNNRFSLFLFCLIVAFCPSDRAFLGYRARHRVHALPLGERIAPTLLRRVAAFQVSLLYLASGGGKALDPDWRSGQTMLVRFRTGIEEATRHGSAPGWLGELMSSEWFGSLASKAAISLELGLAIGLWFPRTRVIALWAGAWFHISIQASARVEVFSFLMGVAYIAFVTPELGERRVLVDPTSALGRFTRRLVPALDWLSRFSVAELPPAERDAHAVVVLDRDGRRATGRSVPGALARALPALFLGWPLLTLIGWTGERRRAT